MLFLVAIANLFTKKIATIYGVTLHGRPVSSSSRFPSSSTRRSVPHPEKPLEEFNLDHQPHVDDAHMHARPGCVLVAVRDFNQMDHLKQVLEKTNLRRHDIVVMTVRPTSSGAGEYELAEEQLFSDYEKELFTRVVTLAEKEGKPVELLVVPGIDPFDAMVQTAHTLKASRLVTGVSRTMAGEELARRIGLAWEKLAEPRHPFSLEIISPDRPSTYVNLGPHPPRLWPEDVDRLHDIWLRLTADEEIGSKLHHRDVVGAALRRMEQELDEGTRQQIIDELKREMRRG